MFLFSDFGFCSDHSGKLDREEFTQALHGLGDHLNQEQIDGVFHHFDPNGEGHVDYGEFQWAFFNRRRLIAAWKDAAGGADVSEQSKLTRMQELFHRFDSQRKGKLQGYQFHKVMEGLGVKLEDWEFAVMLKRFDSDGDGFVDYTEFFRFMEEQVGHKLGNEGAAAGGGSGGGARESKVRSISPSHRSVTNQRRPYSARERGSRAAAASSQPVYSPMQPRYSGQSFSQGAGGVQRSYGKNGPSQQRYGSDQTVSYAAVSGSRQQQEQQLLALRVQLGRQRAQLEALTSAQQRGGQGGRQGRGGQQQQQQQQQSALGSHTIFSSSYSPARPQGGGMNNRRGRASQGGVNRFGRSVTPYS